ncbi:MAG TPA: helix-turn-helix transcriptional regulator, partial [Planctomycetota bacterium]|nr:helix-turn-helix transcriptional regulator [Planctomycetota bacterium]
MLNSRYRWELLPRLASAIEHAERRAARNDLSDLLDIFEEASRDLTVRKMRCAQTMSACIRAARRGGGSSETIYAEHLPFLERLSKLRSWPAVQRACHAYIESLIELVEPAKRSPAERIVAGIIKDIRATLADPRTLEQYAHELDLSVGHLSRMFSSVAGRPFREEVRRLRMEAAAELLRKTDLKVETIAQRVGLRSPSQFIMDFRRM